MLGGKVERGRGLCWLSLAEDRPRSLVFLTEAI